MEDRFDSLGAQFDSLGRRLDALDTTDLDAVSRAADELSEQVTRAVRAQVVPKLLGVQDAAVRISAEVAPRLAEIGTRVVAEVVPAIVQGLCDGGLCDDSSAPVTRHKVLPKHRR
jgi:hypothetical protein